MVGQPRVHPDVVSDVEVGDVVGVHPLPAELAQVPLHGELRPPGAGEAGEEGGELLGEHDVIRGEGAEDAPVDGEEVHQVISIANLYKLQGIKQFFIPLKDSFFS